MKSERGFTLIELLAVIVILAIILAVTIPGILGIMEGTKNNAYESQTKIILDAAKKYISINESFPSLNSEKIITIKDLQDNGYLSSNITDPKTGLAIPPTTWIIIKNDNGDYKYELGYVSNGLVLLYDEKNNGGIGIHNDNESINKGTWIDLSGNGNNGVLNNFSYTSSSGWYDGGLNFDGTDDWVGISKLNYDYMTVEAVYSINKSFSGEFTVVANYEGGGIGVQPTSNNVKGAACIAGSYRTLYGQSIVINKIYKTSVTSDGNQVVLYDNDNISNMKVSGVINIPGGNTVFALGTNPYGSTPSTPYFSGKIYAVRIYNRALTADEIKHNYEVDKFMYPIS